MLEILSSCNAASWRRSRLLGSRLEPVITKCKRSVEFSDSDRKALQQVVEFGVAVPYEKSADVWNSLPVQFACRKIR